VIVYVLRRLGVGLVLALLVTVITFALLVGSGALESVVRSRLGPSATPEGITGMMTELGFDHPVTWYLNWLGDIFTGDFGTSLFTSQPVADAVLARLAVTLSLVVSALIITVIVSVALGVLSASRGGVADKVSQGLSLLGYLVPGLLIAIGLVVVLAVNLKLFPAGGYVPFSESPARWVASIVLPVIVLVIGGMASMTAQIRGSMIDELRKDYVRTLRTRGISTKSVVLRHGLRNAAGPALTVLSLEFLQMLGGAMIIENVFALPGYGAFALNSSLQGDIPVIMGITVFGVMLVITVNLVTDIVNGWLNPKARIY
jgi:peptide/nickel transport system permease protein